MAIIYSTTAINFRLAGVVSAIDSGPGSGVLRLLDGVVVLADIVLAKPCGVVAAGVLTFVVPQTDLAANANGNANGARIENSAGVVMISGLTVGIPGSGANIIITNGFNTTAVVLGQTVTLVSGQIIGS